MKFENQQFHNCVITLTDSTKFNVTANWLHNEGLDEWNQWYCDAGHTRIYIDSTLDVYSGECWNDYLGNLQHTWDIFPSASICNRARCSSCTDDLLVKKVKYTNI